ncbi:WbqC family protein [Caballeronia cordobensis]|nr:WbqC family protein [Caballeronia cordobensis]
MRLAIMQPYFFPYIGYFQLVAAVDRFVFYDDVNFIKNGWINRNRVLDGERNRYVTVPLSGASPSLKIRDIAVQPREIWLRKMLESIRHAYAKAPHYAAVSALIEQCLSAPVAQISALASRSVVDVCHYLDIDTAFVPSSTQFGNSELKGVNRVLDICAKERAGIYVNLPGGRDLYDDATFRSNGVELAFVEPNLSAYAQFDHAFQPGLSILDVLMFNSKDRVRAMLSVEARS